MKNMGSGNTATLEEAIASSQKPRFRPPARVLRHLLIPAAWVLVVAITITYMAAHLADQNLSLSLLQQARLVAQAIDIKHVQLLSGTKADLVSPDYLRLKEQLGSIRSANAQCRFLYLLGRQPDGKIVFFVDSEPSDSKDYSPPGQLFDESTADLLRMFETKESFVEGPVTDSWGTWVSAVVPLIDPKTGALVAVLGMDIDAHLWTLDVAARVALPVGLLLVILIGMTSVYLATRPVGRDRTGRHRDFEPKPVLRRLMPPLAAMVILLLTGAGVELYWQHRQQLTRDIASVTADVSNDLRLALNQQTVDLTVAAQTIAADTMGRKALRESDDKRLLATWQPVFETLRREKHITHFYFLDTRRVCLLRLHKPDKKGDRIERFTALEAERTGKTASGAELGPMGTFTLRTVQPVFESGTLVGYVELGKEIEDTLKAMHPRPGVQMAVSIRKAYLSQQAWEEGMRMLGREADWNRLPRSVLIYTSQGRLPDVFAPMADHDESSRHTQGAPDRQLAFAGRDWRVSALPLTDVSGKEVGDVLVMCDISEGQAAFARLVILGGTGCGVLLALLLGFVYVLLRQTDRLIRSQVRELRESEESYHNQFANNSAVMLLIDPADGTIIDANTAALNFYGYPRERLLTMLITDINTPPMAEALQTVAAVRETFGQRLQTQHRLADGSVRQVETSLSRIQFGGRTVLHAIVQDITEQKRAEESLRENHDMIVKLAAQVPGTVYQYRLYPDGRSCFPFSSPGIKAIYEVTPEEVRNDAAPVFGRLHPDDHDRIAEAIHESARSLLPFHCEFRVVLPEQGMRWRLSDAVPERTADGGTLWHGIISDITERKQMEAYRDMRLNILQILNEPDCLTDSIRRVLAALKDQTGFDAVGLRLQDGEDFPYFAQQGFSEDFLLTENTLTERRADGVVCRDKDGKVCLECTCGLVISGKTDPSHPPFTRGGSFWTNDSAPLLDLPPDQDPRHHPRNECIHQGYASVALIPVRDKERIVGLLHLNGRRKGCFSLATIKFLEDLAAHIGAALVSKRAEDGLRASEAKFRDLIENLQVGVVVHAPDTSILLSNPMASEILGLTSEQMQGKTAIDPAWRFVREDGTKLPLPEYPVSQALGAGIPASGLVIGIVRQERQSPTLVECFSRKIWSPAGDLDQVIITFSDITARRNAEAAVRESVQMVEGIINALPVRVFWKDKQLAYLGCNVNFARDAGFSGPQDILGKDDFQMGWRAQAEAYRTDDRAVIETGIAKLLIEEIQTSLTGETLTLLTSKLPLRDSQGEIRGVLGAYMDITAHKQAAEKLHKSDEQFRTLAEVAPVGIYLCDPDGKCLYANQVWCDMAGVSAAEARGEGWAAGLHPDDRNRVFASWNQMVESHGKWGHEYRFQARDGRVTWVYGLASPQYDPSGKIIQYVGVNIDITERKRIEEVQAFLAQTGSGGESEPFFNTLARYLAQSLNMDFVCIDRLDGDGLNARTVAVWHDGHFEDNVTYALKDTPCGDVVGKQVCCFPASVCQFFPRDQVLKDLRAESYVGVTLFGHTGKPVGLIAVIGRGPLANRPLAEAVLKLVAVRASGEIERQEAEAELQKIEKLQSVGTLAGGIAHDFNNVLLGLFGNISIAMDDLSKEHPSYAPLAEAEKSMTRAVRLTKQLLTFAKGGDPVKEHVSLGAMVEEVARFDLSGSNVRLVYHHDADLWPVDADKGQIQQVISNLVINARQAMPNGGNLTITLENADLPAAAVPAVLRPGRYVKVVVRDEGCGIEPKVIAQIFDPYFTTKQSGNGLGLATVWSIINKHGGHIGVVSELGKGTTFTYYLPASSSRLSAEEESPSAEIPSPASPAKILVMDDEVMVCDLVSKMLARYGYSVATAPDGQEAIALYRQALDAGAPFDLVIMDLTIPGGPGGKEVIKDLLALDPRVRAIVSSGYADDPIMANPAAYGFKGTVAKPYTANALREAVARVLT